MCSRTLVRVTAPTDLARLADLTALEELAEAVRALPAAQQPDWPDRTSVDAVGADLSTLPPLVFAGECDALREQMASVARGEAFLLQGGDCAETFADLSADQVRDKIKTILQMSVVLTYAASVPVVKVARMAGQFGKPRSSGMETRAGVSLPSYRGGAVNDLAFVAASRQPDPTRLLRAWATSCVVRLKPSSARIGPRGKSQGGRITGSINTTARIRAGCARAQYRLVTAPREWPTATTSVRPISARKLARSSPISRQWRNSSGSAEPHKARHSIPRTRNLDVRWATKAS